MKIHSGFISNSSSCSFMAIGAKIKGTLNDFAKQIGYLVEPFDEYNFNKWLRKEYELTVLSGGEDGVDGVYIGVELARGDSDGYYDTDYTDMSHVDECRAKITKLITDESVELIFGIRSC